MCGSGGDSKEGHHMANGRVEMVVSRSETTVQNYQNFR